MSPQEATPGGPSAEGGAGAANGRKRLPLNPEPPVDGYLNQAYPLSILSADDSYLPWFHSNYIQLYCPANFPEDHGHFNFFMHAAYPALVCPLLDTQWLDRDIIDGCAAVVPFAVHCLERSYYLQLFVDEFHLAERINSGRQHYIHDLLIFGYDRAQQQFDTIGYNDKGVYAPGRVAFADLERAYESVRQLPQYHERFFFRKIWLARRVTGYECSFDLVSAVEQLQDFLLGRDTSRRFRMINPPREIGAYRFEEEDVYGRATYDLLRRYLDLLAAGECDVNPIPLHTFYQHKRCMTGRVRYMEELGLLKPGRFEALEQIEQSTETLRMMLLRFAMRRDSRLIDRARDRFGRIVAAEKPVLEELLEALSVIPTED